VGFASMRAMVRDAYENHYAVGHVNINNLEFLQAAVEAAEAEEAPVILGVSEGAIKYMGLEYTVAIGKAAADKARVPVALHLDHGSSFEWVVRTVRAGFSSIMIDASRFPLDENIALTRKVVELCHPLGIDVEAELGRIGGTDDDLTVDERLATLARADEAAEFVRQTGVDALAAAIGSAHGRYKGRPELHFDRLAEIRQATDTPLVLHGGSGIPDEDVQRAIALGVSKVNINTENQELFSGVVRDVITANADMFDPRKYLGPARQAMKEAVQQKLRLLGSSRRAPVTVASGQ
jgi:fructose-bisphosphate aldolase class II